jgi:hypothetical protein
MPCQNKRCPICRDIDPAIVAKVLADTQIDHMAIYERWRKESGANVEPYQPLPSLPAWKAARKKLLEQSTRRCTGMVADGRRRGMQCTARVIPGETRCKWHDRGKKS